MMLSSVFRWWFVMVWPTILLCTFDIAFYNASSGNLQSRDHNLLLVLTSS